MSCAHPIVDKGLCYYCGSPTVSSGSGNPGPGEVARVFTVDDIPDLKLAIDAITDAYSRLPDEERKEQRAKFQRAAAMLSPTLNALREINYKDQKSE